MRRLEPLRASILAGTVLLKMNDDARNLSPFFAEFEAEIEKLSQTAGEAAQLYADGDLQSACNLVNVLHNNVSGVQKLREALVKDFEEMGLKPGS